MFFLPRINADMSWHVQDTGVCTPSFKSQRVFTSEIFVRDCLVGYDRLEYRSLSRIEWPHYTCI